MTNSSASGWAEPVTLAVEELLVLCRCAGVTLPPPARFTPASADPERLAVAESVAARCLYARGLIRGTEEPGSTAAPVEGPVEVAHPELRGALATLHGWRVAADLVIDVGGALRHVTLVTAGYGGASLAVRAPGLVDVRWFPAGALVVEVLDELSPLPPGEGRWELPYEVVADHAKPFADGDDSMLLMGLIRQRMPGRAAVRLIEILRGRSGYGVFTVHRRAPDDAGALPERVWIDADGGRYAIVTGERGGEPTAAVEPFDHEEFVRFVERTLAPSAPPSAADGRSNASRWAPKQAAPTQADAVEEHAASVTPLRLMPVPPPDAHLTPSHLSAGHLADRPLTRRPPPDGTGTPTPREQS